MPAPTEGGIKVAAAWLEKLKRDGSCSCGSVHPTSSFDATGAAVGEWLADGMKVPVSTLLSALSRAMRSHGGKRATVYVLKSGAAGIKVSSIDGQSVDVLCDIEIPLTPHLRARNPFRP